MEYNNKEYIQDIAFNYTCVRMVISTTSKKIIIYKKIQENSDCLISIQKNENENKSNNDSNNNSNIKLEFLSFQKNKEFEYRWEEIQNFVVDGPVLRIQWANIDYGNIFACSGYNKCIYLFKEEKNDKTIKWNHIIIKIFPDAVMDISFLPNIYSLGLAALTLDGYLKILKFSFELGKPWEENDIKIPKISNDGCTCLCCNPSNLDELTIVIGCKINKKEKEKDINEINIIKKENYNNNIKNNVKNKNSLLKLILFKKKSFKIQSINDFSHKNDITDVDWANQNGRNYHMICSTSKDGKFIIWEINLFEKEKINEDDNFFTYKKIFEFNHDKPLWRCSFNESGIMASCIDEDGETFSFLKISKSKFIKLDIQNTK